MQEDELTAAAAALVTAIVRFEQRCRSIEQQHAQFMQQLPMQVQEKVDRVLHALSGRVGSTVREGLEPSIEACQQRVQETAEQAERSVRVLKADQVEIASQRRRMVWSLGAVIALCILSLVATYEGLYGYYQTQFSRLKSEVNYLDAIHRSDVVPCGDGQLCARVDDKAPRYGDNRQYRVVKPRQ
jgi:hypothetical protein